MSAELGLWCLALAWGLALIQCVASFVGAVRGDVAWMNAGASAACMQGVLLALASGLLIVALLAHDFSVDYVARHSNRLRPAADRVAAAWGGHEGSLLLWTLMLAGCACWAGARVEGQARAFAARVQGAMGLVSFGLLAWLILSSNPFARTLPAPPDGRVANLLLQDPAR